MKIKFDSSQPFQKDAVNAIINLFEGQSLSKEDFSVQINTTALKGQTSVFQSELGIGNSIILSADAIYKNFVSIQEKNDLDPIEESAFSKNGMNFSVEMETGTGKTYVYLRTIFELNQKYGFKKFIIVVPGVAIREGTLKNLDITRDHFRTLYNNVEFEYFVYDSKRANRLRQFATSNLLQIMLINIDSFRKDFSESDDETKSNVIFKENDRLSGRRPIEFVQATNPFVIIDEPQSVDNTPRAQEAIKSLNSICIFRFSATHKNLYNLVYKLDPIRAYQLGLVKQIVVASVTGANAQNDAYVRLLEVDNTKGIRAKIRIQVEGKNKVTEKDLWVNQNSDLFAISNEREAYRNGFEVLDINAEPGNEFIDFTVGRLYKGQERGGIKSDMERIQIRNTIKKHLDKEVQLFDQGIKVLSLFFVDRVANYKIYSEDGKTSLPGKFAIMFDENYNELIKLPQYSRLSHPSTQKVHDGYFSQDRKGIIKDTSGATQADDDTYAKIMRNKEQLLSIDEPLKFIFSHSALREGWDNPNVFQICTLNESQSATKKRQEIGRGLRLPVNQNGDRIFDENINKLTVIANESYEEFATKLQIEYEEECGTTFGKVPKFAFKGINQWTDEGEIIFTRKESEELWDILVTKGVLDKSGKILSSFRPSDDDYTLNLPDQYKSTETTIVHILQNYQLDRHIRKDTPPKQFNLNKRIFLDPEFEALWNRIKYRTTYQVEYSTEKLIEDCVTSIRRMEPIDPVIVDYREAQLDIKEKGVTSQEIRASSHKVAFTGDVPDIISYIQKQTELTRKTIVEILKQSDRLKDFLINPQRFMDEISSIITRELHCLIIDGIKYEKLSVGNSEWSMQLFRDDELKEYFDQCLEVQKSVFDKIPYDSEVERKFAEDLEKREDIKLFVKLPTWFKVDTPVGHYNPDWAIVKHEDATIYLVRETKGTGDFEKLRNLEADKIKCGRKHFEAIGVNFDVVVKANEI